MNQDILFGLWKLIFSSLSSHCTSVNTSRRMPKGVSFIFSLSFFFLPKMVSFILCFVCFLFAQDGEFHIFLSTLRGGCPRGWVSKEGEFHNFPASFVSSAKKLVFPSSIIHLLLLTSSFCIAHCLKKNMAHIVRFPGIHETMHNLSGISWTSISSILEFQSHIFNICKLSCY